MKKLSICPLDFEQDVAQIKLWETQFSSDNKFNSIKHFILEDDTYYGLDEVIKTNYEFFHIGDDERKYCLSVKDKNKTVGFILGCVFNLSIDKPELIIQYIVLRPDYQHMGYGTQILNELLTNCKKYFACNPIAVNADVEKNNLASKKLFSKMGFTFNNGDPDYLRAEKDMLTKENERL